MDNASIAVQVGQKSVVAYIVSKARKHGVHVPKAPRANSIQTQFQKAIQNFMKRVDEKFAVYPNVVGR